MMYIICYFFYDNMIFYAPEVSFTKHYAELMFY